ncbi:MAG: DUF1206 domain-containing protein [Steroidobacteraceae bacterium]
MRAAVPGWVDPLMRFGYAARGIVYLLVGALALIAVRGGGAAPDSKGAFATLMSKPFGTAVLVVIALGLVAYAAWRFIDALFDLERKGEQPSGWVARSAQAISGLIYLSLAASAVRLIEHRGSGGDGAESWSAKLMAQPFGRWAVAVVGVAALGFAIFEFVTAYRESYKKQLRYTPLAARLNPIVKFGLIAHGVVVLIIAGFFFWAAWTADPSRAGGLGDALNAVRTAEFGRAMLALLAVGLLSFSVHCFIEAMYRIVPRCSPPDLQTLAIHARAMQRNASAAVAASVHRLSR